MARGDLPNAQHRQAGVQFAWPVDDNGAPMELLTFQMSELIGLPNFSNVTVGPASATRFVKAGDTTDGFKKLANDVETIMRDQREIILNIVKSQTAP